MWDRLKELPHKTRLLLVGGIAFLVFLPALAPAYLVMLAVPGDNVGITGIGGSIWNGSAERVSIDGFTLNATRWKLKPAALLSGGLELHVVTSWAGGEFEGDLRAGITGALGISNASIFGSLDELSSGMPLSVAGQMSLVIEKATLADNWPTTLLAELNVRGLTAPQPGSDTAALVGDYSVIFSNESVSEENPLVGTVIDTGGPLDLDGTITLLPPNQYLLDVKITPETSAAPALTQGLQFMAPADNSGVHNLKLNSNF